MYINEKNSNNIIWDMLMIYHGSKCQNTNIMHSYLVVFYVIKLFLHIIFQNNILY